MAKQFHGWHRSLNARVYCYFEDRIKRIPSRVSFCHRWRQATAFEPQFPDSDKMCKNCRKRVIRLMTIGWLSEDTHIG